MTLLDRVNAARLPRELARAASPVSMDEFGRLLAMSRGDAYATKSGATVGPERALGITAWYSGVRYISETIAGLPVKTYRDVRGERSVRTDPSWLKSPDIEQTWYGLVEFIVMSLLHRGNSYSFKLRNEVGQVTGLRELRPDRVTTGQAPDGTKRFLVDEIERPFTSREILHIPGLAYNGRIGLNPIATSAEALGTIAAADDYAGRFFGSGTHMGGVLSVPELLDQDSAIRLKAEWDRFHQGLANAHQTGVLSKGVTYQPLSLNAHDTQLIESRTYGVTEIARLLRLPPHKLYELSRATFSNIEHQSIEAITDGIQPWVERIEAWINADPHLLPLGNFIEFNLEGRLRGATTDRYAAYTASVGAPWQTPNEARRRENMAPIDGGDTLLSPLNMGQSATQIAGGGQ